MLVTHIQTGSQKWLIHCLNCTLLLRFTSEVHKITFILFHQGYDLTPMCRFVSFFMQTQFYNKWDNEYVVRKLQKKTAFISINNKIPKQRGCKEPFQ